MNKVWRNWSHNVVHTNLAEIYKPRSKRELVDAVKDAARRKLTLRVVGTGHSWRNLGLPKSPGALLDMRCLREVTFNNNGTATVEAGITLNALNIELFEHGLALENLGDTDRQTIAGAIATDTHGSGKELGSLSEFVEAMTMVNSKGEVYEVKPEHLPATRVSLGRLGVVYDLTIKLVKAFYLRHEGRYVTMPPTDEELHDLLKKNRNIEFWYYPYTDRAKLMTRNVIDRTKPKRYRLKNLRITVGAMLLDNLGRFWPKALPRLMRFLTRLKKTKVDVREGPSHMILPLMAQTTVDWVKTLTMEYLFPLDRFWDAHKELEESIEVAKSKGIYISIPVHMRFVAKKKKETLLSPYIHEPTASFSINFSTKYPGAKEWFQDFERRMLDLCAHTHLGKIHFKEPKPNLEFLTIESHLDPDEMFSNSHWPITL